MVLWIQDVQSWGTEAYGIEYEFDERLHLLQEAYYSTLDDQDYPTVGNLRWLAGITVGYSDPVPVGNPISYNAYLTMTADVGNPTVSIAVGHVDDPDKPNIGTYVQNFTTLTITPTVTPKFGASVVSVQISSPNGVYTTTSGATTLIKLTTDGEYQFSVTATDSRGFSVTETQSVQVVKCNKPSFTSVAYYKVESAVSTTENDEGEYLYVSATCLMENRAQSPVVTVTVKELGSSQTFVSGSFSLTFPADSDVGSMSGHLGDSNHLFDKEKSYTVTFSTTDGYSLTATFTGTVTAALYTIHRQSGGRGVAFGRISELYGVEVNADWPFYTHGQEIQQLIVDLAHPVGSVIETLDDSFDPNVLWPWTLWGKLNDVFLYANGQKNTGVIGGSLENGVVSNPYEYPSGSGNYTDAAPSRIQLQGDGNLVVYSDDTYVTPWSSGTYSSTVGGNRHTFVFGNTQASVSENNMPPYLTVNMWVRAR